MTWRIDRFRMTGAVSISSDKTSEPSTGKKLALPGRWRHCWQFGMAMALGIGGAITLTGCFAIAFSGNRANAQSNIVPDGTLGNESSVVVPNFQGLPVEAIGGGAARGQNLFHSFQEFNVSAGRGAYFFSPNSNIQNILARVTGNNLSQILGTLGTFGNSSPNLFLINPNGIIFGANASLDVGGSFVATTANAIRLGDTGLFSATQPQSSNLLSVNPNAFFYNQLSNQGQIVNRSTATTTVLGAPTSGLQVPDGRSLLLVGGDVRSEGGRLFALGGRIELGGVAQNGTVGLNGNGNELRLSFPTDVSRADVFLTNESEVNVRAGAGGSIAINARNLDVLGGSKVRAGIASGMGSPESKAGDIDVNATGTMTVAGELSFLANVVQPEGEGKGGGINIKTGSLFVKEGGAFNAATLGRGDAGNVTILARDIVSFDGVGSNGTTSGAVSAVTQGAVGKGGDINITTGSLEVTNGAFLSASTLGQGNSGNVRITATDTVRFDGVSSNGFSSIASTNVGTEAVGNGGGIEITTGSLEVTNGASLLATTAGQGKAGSVSITARDTVRFDGVGSNGQPSAAISSVATGVVGDGGNIEIDTGSLSVTNGAQLFASTFGQGKAGSMSITARDTVRFDGVGSNGISSSATSSVGEVGVGDGGDIVINTGSLSVTNGAFLSADTNGQGNAGSVRITATDTVSFDGVGSNGVSSSASSAVLKGGVGNGGDIEITTGSLEVTNGAGLTALTYGKGNAGSVRITATDTVSFDGVGSNGLPSSATGSVGNGVVGNGGDIEITTGSLEVTNGASLYAATAGRGNAGSVKIIATDTVRFDGADASTNVGRTAVGNGGDIEITTGSLSVTNGASLFATTAGQGNAGSVKIIATDTVRFDGADAFTNVGRTAVGNGGDIEITTGSLEVTNDAGLTAFTYGKGNAGNVRITARDTVRFDDSGALSSVAEGAVGDGGDIVINTGSLEVTNGAGLISSTFGQGSSGNVRITANDSLSVTNGAYLTTSTDGQGNAGSVRINVGNTVSFDGVGSNGVYSGAYSSVGPGGQGKGGDIEITSGSLSLTDAYISSVSLGTDTAGDITLSTRQNLEMNRGQILATTQADDGGNIKLGVGNILLMRNGSKISTTAGEAGAGGNGGNIDINADFIVGVPKENSDITANAYNGRGGNINITTSGIYGLKYRPQLTPYSDITASSKFGLNGDFKLALLTSVDPSRGLAQLPTNVVDASQQIDRRCTSSSAKQGNSFTITGRGGIPSSPNDTIQGESVITPNWVTLNSNAENNTPPIPTTPRSSAPRKLVEAQGWIINEFGQVVLTVSAPKVTPQGTWFPEPECNPGQTS